MITTDILKVLTRLASGILPLKVVSSNPGAQNGDIWAQSDGLRQQVAGQTQRLVSVEELYHPASPMMRSLRMARRFQRQNLV